MTHPAYQPAVLSVDRAATADTPGYFAPPGKPARFPEVVVHNSEDEEAHRARGYLLPGESRSRMTHPDEYPKMLRHPDYKPAVAASQQASLGPDGRVMWIPVPAIPEPFPDVQVDSLRAEREWIAKGWLPGGRWDQAAYERAMSTPDTDYEPEEWPKWVDTEKLDENGRPVKILVQDPNAMTPAQRARAAAEYPKYVGDAVVQNADEEAAVRRGEPPYVSSRKSPVVLGSDPLKQRVEAPAVDVGALKKEILGELLPQLRDVIREALQSNSDASHKPSSVTKETLASMQNNYVPLRKQKTPEERKALGARLAAGRARKKEERERGKVQGSQSDGRVQAGVTTFRLEKRTEG